MSDISERYARLADGFRAKVAAVPPGAWENPSPCEGWTARDVVRHVVDSHGIFLSLVGRGLGDIPSVDDDPLGAFDAARAVVQADLEDPARAGEEYEGMFGRTTFAASVDRFLGMDLLVHAWDLARAAGIDDTLDPDEVRRALGDAQQMGDALRSPGVCGPAVVVPESADDQTRLVAFLGRQP